MLLAGPTMSESSFFVRNKTAIAVSVLAGASAIGAYYYYSQQIPNEVVEPAKKKKSKKKKAPKEVEEKVPYPVGADGFPDISDAVIAGLTEAQKDEWALALKKAGNDEYKAEKFTEAIVFYSAALKIKVDPVFYSNRSACYAALDKHEEVIADATAAIKIKPDYAKCILRRATSYEALEQYPDAMFDLTALSIYGAFNSKSVEQTLERVLQKHSLKIVEAQVGERNLELPSASAIGSLFGAYVPETSPHGISEESTGADKFLFDALAAINANTLEKYQEADSLFHQAVEAYHVGTITSESEDAAKASIALEYAGGMSFLKGNATGAYELIEKAMALKPRARTYIMRAMINADKSSFDEAVKDFRFAQESEPENPDVYYHLGQLYYLTGDLGQAEQYLLKAKQYNPENVFAYIQLACIVYKNGKFEDAEKAFTEARLKFPTSPEVLNYYGEILADHGDIPAAIKQYETAARLQEALPNFSVGSVPLINKASMISREGLDKMPEAEELLTKACELDPRSEVARISLAQVKLQIEKQDEAIALFEEGSRLARTLEEKIQATSFAEATKMQLRIKADPVLSRKIQELYSGV